MVFSSFEVLNTNFSDLFVDTNVLNESAYFITNLSPIKSSGPTRYFDMTLVSEITSRGVVCFEPH